MNTNEEKAKEKIFVLAVYAECNNKKIETSVYKTEEEAKAEMIKSYNQVISEYYEGNKENADMANLGKKCAFIIGGYNFEWQINEHEI